MLRNGRKLSTLINEIGAAMTGEINARRSNKKCTCVISVKDRNLSLVSGAC